nr:phospholipase-like protein [Tanacetum cinerariifolium]
MDDVPYDAPLIYHVKGQVNFVSRVLPNKVGVKVTNLDLRGIIEDEERFGGLSDKDAVRVCLLLSLEVIFMGRLLVDVVDDSHMRLVENIKEWNVFHMGSTYGGILIKEFIESMGSPVFGIGALIQDQDSDDDLIKTQDYLIQEEIRLRAEQEETWRLQEQKMMEEVFVKRLKEEVRLRVEKEKLVNYEEEKNKRRHDFLNSDHWKASTSTVSNDVKPWDEELLRPNRTTDRVHLTDAFDIYLGRRGPF